MFSVAAACASPEERIENYTESGETFLEEGDLGRANIQFQNALKINEEHVPALLGLVDIAEKKNDYRNMFGLLQRVIRLDPDNLDAQVKIGKLYLVASDETAALEHADKALSLAPEDADALALKAAIQLKLGDTAGAVELANRVIEQQPANPEAVTVIATERTLAGDYEGALAELDRALALKPDVAIVQLLRISILTRLGRNDDVRQAYANLIDLFPEESAYRRVYAMDLIEREQLDDATAQLEKIAELEPDNLDAKLDVIRVILENEGEAAATDKIKTYADASPDDIDLQFALAAFYRQNGKNDLEFEQLSSLARSEDMDIVLRARNEIAAYHLRNGDRETAEGMIADILATDERNTDALIKRAGLLIDDGSYDEAILDLRTALDNDPDSADVMALMALAFEKQGEPSVARAEFAKAFEASGQSARIGSAFANFHLRQGDRSRAEEVLVDSLASNPGDLDNLKLLAAIRLAQQNWRGAEEVADIIERLENQNELAERIKSAAFAGLGDYDLMIKTLSAQNENTPLESRPLAALVSAYIRSDRADEAEELLLKVIDSQEDNYTAHILLAQVYGAKQQQDDAVDILQKATEKDPARSEAFELLYRYFQRTGQSEKAKALITDGLAKAPDNAALRIFQADALLSDGQLEEAFQLYEALVEEQPENRVVANNYVSLASDLRQDAASVQRALEVAKVLEEVDNPLFKDTVGWAYYRAGDFGKAVEFLSEASEVASGNAEIAYHLGAAYYAAGDMDNARTALERALGAGGDGFRYADEINDLLARM
ncbi:MAG: tetratricopeptide repeat protein [Hyphococcus sp.]